MNKETVPKFKKIAHALIYIMMAISEILVILSISFFSNRIFEY